MPEMADWTKSPCPACNGTGDSNPNRPEGLIGWSPCSYCDGSGLVAADRPVVEVPNERSNR